MLKNLVSEYFELTGRPVSTMTVDEFLTFQKYIVATVKDMNPSNEPLIHSQPTFEMKKEGKNLTIIQNDIPKTTDHISQKDIEVSGKSTSTLAMLKSVSG